MADEVEIIITVESDQAVAGIEKVVAAEKALDDQSDSIAKRNAQRAKQAEQLDTAQAKRYKDATDLLTKQKKAMEDLQSSQQKMLQDGGRTRTSGKFDSNATMLKKFADDQKALTKLQQNELKARTGYTTTELAKQNAVFDRAARAQTASQAREEANRLRSATRAAADTARVADKAASDTARATEKANRAAQGAADKSAKDALKTTKDLQRDIAKAEDDAFRSRTSTAQKFVNDMERMFGAGKGNRGGGGGFMTSGKGGGSGRFSRNPFIDLGGRGAQPRTIGIGSLVGLAGAAAGPVGAAAGGLIGAIPGAAVGLASAAAALKMSGIGTIVGDAQKIKTIQDQINEGVTKEAKGRAQIAVIMDGLSAKQKEGLALWNGWQVVIHKIGDQAQNILLPAFGAVGKMLATDAPIFAKGITNAASSIAGLMKGLSGFLSGGLGKGLLTGTEGAGSTFISGLTGNLLNLSKTFFGVGNASQAFMRQMSTMSQSVTKGLASWSDSKGGQAQLKEFFAVAAQEVPRVLGLFKDLGKVLFTIFAAALPFANQLIDAIRKQLQNFNSFLQSSRGQNDMKQIFMDIAAAVKVAASLIKALWPMISGGFNLISGIVKTFSSLFGNTMGAVFSLAAAGFISKFVGPVSGGIQKITKKLLLMAVKNPWIDAAAGVAILGLAIYKLSQGISAVHQDALDTANAIKAVFTAGQRSTNNRLNLNVAQDTLNAAQGTLGSANVKLNRDQNTPGISSRVIDADIAAWDRDRLAVANARAEVQKYQDAVDQAGKDKASALANSAKDVAKAWKQALSDQKMPTTMGGARVLQNILPPDAVKQATSEFAGYFKKVAGDSDSAGVRVQAAMLKLDQFVEHYKKAPTQKQVAVILKDVASMPLRNILRLLGLVLPKNFKIQATNVNQTLMDVHKVNEAKIADKHFTIVGAYRVPSTPLIPQSVGPDYLKPAGGGILPGVGGHDTIPAMLRPGEVVLNRAQQYDFGGPETFKNYFASKSSGMTSSFASGGVVNPRLVGQLANESMLHQTTTNAKGVTTIAPVGGGYVPPPAVGGGVATITNPSMDAEPGMQAVLNDLANKEPLLRSWKTKLSGDMKAYYFMRDNIVAGDVNQRSDLYLKLDRLKDVKGKTATAQRKEINLQIDRLSSRYTQDVKIKRRYSDAATVDREHIKAASKVYSHIPGYDGYQGQKDAAEAQQTALELVAANLPALDPNADPNAPNGITTLTNAYKNYSNQFNSAVSSEVGAASSRIAWLNNLIPQLKARPKYRQLANSEVTDDQNDILGTLGKTLADYLPSGTGPGDTVTQAGTATPGGTSWADQPLTQQFQQFIAGDIAQAALATLDNNPNNWIAAMNDEATQYWGRIQDLRGVMDNPAYSQWRTDILGEITDDVGNYQSVTSAITAGFAASVDSTASSTDDNHVQDVIDAANTLMSQINVGSSSERESLGLLTDFLRSQVPSSEVGANYVGKTGLRMVHQGEMITPRGDVHNGPMQLQLMPSGDGLADALVAHLEPKLSYAQGQKTRRHSRERRR